MEMADKAGISGKDFALKYENNEKMIILFKHCSRLSFE
jgi:hypothetical protein